MTPYDRLELHPDEEPWPIYAPEPRRDYRWLVLALLLVIVWRRVR